MWRTSALVPKTLVDDNILKLIIAKCKGFAFNCKRNYMYKKTFNSIPRMINKVF